MGLLGNLFSSGTSGPQVRIYHSYGDADRCFVIGHVLEEARPMEAAGFRKGNFLQNARAMLQLFRVKPQPLAQVEVRFGGVTVFGQAKPDGFFHIDLVGDAPHQPGWHPVSVRCLDGAARGLEAEGKIFHPTDPHQGFISDIDDTLLISHSKNLLQRLRVYLTKTPETRRPFEGVVQHYQALARHQASAHAPNPFFYVSSSEWNLYDYIKNFCRHHGFPEGIFLLSDIRKLGDFLEPGSKDHHSKYDRIARILEEYPNTRFVLLGDDTQQDPDIYRRIVSEFGEQVNAVYMRRRNKEAQAKARTQECLEAIRQKGIPVCYFRHSREALAHSQSLGLAD